MPNDEFEAAAHKNGFRFVCGVDEAGRGPLAGPVCAAAVILPQGFALEGLNDSKKLSEKKREALFPLIQQKAVSWSVAFATVEEIEAYNILNATYLAMNRAINTLQIPADFALIDGNRVPTDIAVPCQTIVKGDSLSLSIAAASVLAKVSRDRLMPQLDQTYPGYNFAVHKGYGTAAHIEKIKALGPCPCHRLSFLKNILQSHGK